MDSKKLALFALGMVLFGSIVSGGVALAADPAPPAEPGTVEDGMPWPPDGVTDPNVEYPTDGTDGISDGEMAAERNGARSEDQSSDADTDDVPAADDDAAPDHAPERHTPD
ncbi:hypothetical protein [Hyphomicrobium sp. D-2]|uniref:hypothetical protein n=1 Tax=Hyphomicrobium sp. D-2 TaxID=3041621 RepID=UPI0024573100|nr:hypothetical protein [Hyphomicrobium sp. D-2]MDH4982216.1 hypothetical protein [Hyphomicrobium sp. D-2]